MFDFLKGPNVQTITDVWLQKLWHKHQEGEATPGWIRSLLQRRKIYLRWDSQI